MASAVKLLLFSCLVVGMCVGSPFESRVLKAPWKLPEGWRQGSRVEGDQGILLHIGVKQQNLKLLNEVFWAVSDPRNEAYGQHLSAEEVGTLVAPSRISVEAVYKWLNSYGVRESQISPNMNFDMLEVSTTVGVAEALLGAQYYYFTHSSGKTVVRLGSSLTLPPQVYEHIDFVGPTTRFPFFRSVKIGSAAPEATVTPQFLRNLYKVGSYAAQSTKTQVAVTGFLEQYINTKDLATFFRELDTESVGRTANIVGPNSTPTGVEANLDIQYVMALGHKVNSTFWSTPGRQPKNKENEPFLQFLYDVANATNAPQIFSISYGDNEDTVDFDYATRVNVEFQKAGVRGISVLASSGDGGVAGSQPTQCQKFIPTYPAASPYVTAVGGTTSSSPEVVADFSGGGFSNYFTQPSYQTSFVSKYFSVAKNLPPANRYNRTGAGFPDVAAQGVNFAIILDGFKVPVSGTSCSSPTFAGLVSNLNDLRLSAGKSTLGYLNTLFYQNPQAFNDITDGSNPGCGTNGFYAAPGWDPVTGLGTPDFEKLSALVKSLP